MKIAIIGAGPAGAHLAYLLSSRGADILLFDARDVWEKPCGGGITAQALREFDWLQQTNTPRQMVSSVRLISAGNREVTVNPRHEFAIYSRAELDRLMRNRVVNAGANLIQARVDSLNKASGKWEISTAKGENYTCDFIVGADGATSATRRMLGIRFPPQDFYYALGWHMKPGENSQANGWPDPASSGNPAQADIKYLHNLSGYLWMFPRADHLSYGIAVKNQETTPQVLKQLLLDFVASQNPALAQELQASNHHSTERATFYGAMIPSLQVASWDKLSACNADDNWALIGDAAGFVDPLTGEGIHYALKSAELLAHCLPDNLTSYDEMWRAEFGFEMRRAAQLLHKFYRGKFAGAPFTERLVQVAKFHRGVRETLRDLLAAEQSYIELKSRLRKNILRI